MLVDKLQEQSDLTPQGTSSCIYILENMKIVPSFQLKDWQNNHLQVRATVVRLCQNQAFKGSRV